MSDCVKWRDEVQGVERGMGNFCHSQILSLTWFAWQRLPTNNLVVVVQFSLKSIASDARMRFPTLVLEFISLSKVIIIGLAIS